MSSWVTGLLPFTLGVFCLVAPGCFCDGGGGGGTDAVATDGATADAALTDTGVTGDAIEAPLEEWTWVDFEDSFCGNGAATGLAVNLTDRSDDVFVFLQGGGACWDFNTCFVLVTAVNIESGYTGGSFANDGIRSAAMFDRADPANPFRDASFVFIPYCTGDVHIGDNVRNYKVLGTWVSVHHKGAVNIDAFLQRLAPTFPGNRRVFLTGSSAGGYGAQFNYHRFSSAMPAAEIHVLSDSAPLMQPWGGRIFEWASAWAHEGPPGCPDCALDFPMWLDHLTSTYPETRFGLLSFDADQTITLFFNFPLDGTFTNVFNVLMTDGYDPVGNAHYFVLAGGNHVLLGALTNFSHPTGPTLSEWVTAWANGDPTWSSVR